MDSPIRSIGILFGRIQRCLSRLETWIFLSVIIISADKVTSEFSVSVKVMNSDHEVTQGDTVKPGTTLNFTCSYGLGNKDISLLYWVDGSGKSLYGLDGPTAAPTVGPEYTGRVYDIKIMEGKHSFKLNATACDTSTYKCSVWDTSSSENTSSVQVTVKDIKEPVVTPKPEEVPQEGKVEFSCKIKDATLDHELNFTIRDNGSLVFNNQKKSIEDAQKCSHSSELIGKVDVKDGPKVKTNCIVTYSDGTVYRSQYPKSTTVAPTTVPSTTTATTNITPVPPCQKCQTNEECQLKGSDYVCICNGTDCANTCELWENPPTSITVEVGAKLTLKCATTTSGVKVSWCKTRGGTPIMSGTSLNIEEAYLSNMSIYYCKAEKDKCSHVKSQQLIVEYNWVETSTNTSNSSEYLVREGASLNVSCIVEAWIAPSVQWYLTMNSTPTIENDWQDLPVTLPNLTVSYLFIENFRKNNSGIYYCKAFHLDAVMIMRTIRVSNYPDTGAVFGVLTEPWFIGVCILAAVVLVVIVIIITVLLLKKNKVRVSTYEDEAKTEPVTKENDEQKDEQKGSKESKSSMSD